MPPTTTSYRTIKADLLTRIQAGEFPPGTRLPDEIDLAERFGVARTTVARAMRELVDDGLIERRRKAGTRVRLAPLRQARVKIPLVRDEIGEMGADYGYRLLHSAITPAPPEAQARLKIGARTRVRHLVCLHLADGAPYQFEDRWINLAAVPDAAEADFTESGPNEWLVGKIPYSSAEIAFCAAEADAEQSAALGCAAGAALFCIERRTQWQRRVLTCVRLAYRHGHRLMTRY